ncbi:nucleotide sugar dehydrogenase [Salinibacter ruber]|uniref:nucleotide sugar dehydrogenase n=1 Tax=Salinibacter ruber TaxID=146919 RepID=UPI000E592DD9|nr:nucleotide sugar dehydrogenase [Salinibacter ruber]
MGTHVEEVIDAFKENGVGTDAQRLASKLDRKQARIGIVGLGYVGLPLAVEFADRGFQTIGFDIDAERVGQLNAGENWNEDIDDETLRHAVDDEMLSAEAGFERAAEVDVFFVCVPTPLDEHKQPDTSYIEDATRSIAEHLRPGQLVVLKSTSYPGTTEEVMRPILEDAAAEKGLEGGRDYFLAFSPERIDPGNEEYTTENTPIVVGGVTDAGTTVAQMALRQIVDQVHPVSGPKVAEMEKLLENIFRSVNIALVNELAQLCDRMGDVSMWEVIDAAATKPFGFMPFYPGPGVGGHCIPVDPHYLSWLASRHDFETSFITLAAQVNEQMPFYVTNAVVEAIAEQPVRLQDAAVLVLGAAFKGNVEDTRHAPARAVIRLLREKGIEQIRFADPQVEEFRVDAGEAGAVEVPRVDVTEETLGAHDVAVLLTDHDDFPYEAISEHVSAVIDARNGFEDGADKENVWLLGGGENRSSEWRSP